MDEEIIIGIDPGTRVTGYAVLAVTGREVRVLDFGCIRPRAKKSSLCYRRIFEAVGELCEKYTPVSVAVEMQFVYKNAKSALKLGIAKGMVMLAASLREIPIFEYAPTHAKKAIVGHGHASKMQVQKMLQNLLKLSAPPEPEDASDALALALCHVHARRGLLPKKADV